MAAYNYIDYINNQELIFDVNHDQIYFDDAIDASSISVNFSSSSFYVYVSINDTHRLILQIDPNFNELFQKNLDSLFYFENGSKIIFGHSESDTIRGGDGNDKLIGFGGNDILYGENGNDILSGDGDINGSGNVNYINSMDGIDHLYGGGGDDILHLGYGLGDYAYGGNGNDTFYINGGSSDYAYGGNGNDIFNIKGSYDQNEKAYLDGGSGNDFFNLVNNGSADIKGGEGSNTYFFNGLNNIWSNTYPEWIYPGDSVNYIEDTAVFYGLPTYEHLITIKDFKESDLIDLNYTNKPISIYYLPRDYSIHPEPINIYATLNWRGDADLSFKANLGESVSRAGENKQSYNELGIKHDFWRVYDNVNHVTKLYSDTNFNNIVDENDFMVYFSGNIGLNHLSFKNGQLFNVDVKTHISYSIEERLSLSQYNLQLADDDRVRIKEGYGNKLDNIIIGNKQDNILDGLGGRDTMSGGLGNDIYYVDNVDDQVIELENEGVDEIRSTIHYTLSTHVENLTLLGLENINATGNGDANTLVGNTGNNIINGLAGADVMKGGKGDDTYYVDNVKDNVVELSMEGTDIIYSSVTYTLFARHVEHMTLTGTDNINAKGNNYNNILIGNSGHNILDGQIGADKMQGGEGNDTYYVDDVNDQVIELIGEGTDLIYSAVNYSLFGRHVENMTLTGTANINATGNSYANTLVGNAGNNILDGQGGADLMRGGQGNDTYYVDHVNDKVIELANEGTDSIYSTVTYRLSGLHVENLTLTGTAHVNAAGNEFANTLIGNSGNNILNGQGGADLMRGGKGNDTYYVDHVNDNVVELANEGTDLIYSAVNYSLFGRHVENMTLTGTANINATGNSYANTLVGNTGNNILDGQGGADLMRGGQGNDTYYVDHVNDKVIELANEGTDSIYSTVTYRLSGLHVENLTLTGTAHVNAAGNEFANTLIGNSGNNILNGQGGADLMRGEKGNDTYYVDHVNDNVVELANEGTDLIYSAVNYSLFGRHVENMTLTGTANINATGNSYANTLVGNAGDNILNGQGGADILKGGLGADTLLYNLLQATDATGGNGSDTILDFKVGKVGQDVNADVIDITDLLIGYNGSENLINIDAFLTVRTESNNTNIYIDRDGSSGNYQDTLLLTLDGVTTSLDKLYSNGQLILV